MNLKIEKTEEKPLVARKEVSGSLLFEGKATPSNAEVAKAIAAELKADEKTVLVKHIYTGFGKNEAEFEAYVYNSEEDLKKYEPVTKAMKEAAKKSEEAAKAEAEAPKEEKPAEAPAEQKKEEAPAEEKKEEPKEEKKEEAPKEEKKEEASAEEKKAE
jgi:ribosomal protein S24E